MFWLVDLTIDIRIFDSLGALISDENVFMVFLLSYYLHSALGRPLNTFPVQILRKSIKKFSVLSVFPIYVIVIFNLDRQFSKLMTEINVVFSPDFIRRIPNPWLKSTYFFGE